MFTGCGTAWWWPWRSVSERIGVKKWNAPSFRTREYFATTNLRAKTGVGVILHFGAKVGEIAAGPKSIADPQSAFQAVLRQWIAYV